MFLNMSYIFSLGQVRQHRSKKSLNTPYLRCIFVALYKLYLNVPLSSNIFILSEYRYIFIPINKVYLNTAKIEEHFLNTTSCNILDPTSQLFRSLIALSLAFGVINKRLYRKKRFVTSLNLNILSNVLIDFNIPLNHL